MSAITNPQSTIANPFTFSQSSLQDYVDCPRCFQLRYIEHLAWPAVETEPALENERRMLAGQLFHRLAQQAIIGLPTERLDRLAGGEDLKRWWDHFARELPHLKTLGKLQTETSLSAPIGEHRLVAKYDLIAILDGKAAIYDWKTSRKRPRDEWMSARLQTLVYRYLLVVSGAHLNGGQPFEPEQVEMLYWYTDFPSEPARFPYSAAHFKRDAAILEKLVAEITSAADFPTTNEDAKCRYCPYRSYCGRGIEAGDWQDAEAETENGLADFEINLEQIAEIEF